MKLKPPITHHAHHLHQHHAHRKHRAQHGYFLIFAVILVLVMGVMATIIVQTFVTRAAFSVSQQNGLNAFYMAESGLEIGARLLTMPTLSGTPRRLTCASLTGTTAVTNAALGKGTFTLTTINSSPIFGIDTLSAAVTATATTIPVTSTSGFAPFGKLTIDREVMNYAAISGNSFIGVTRATSGTSAASHASGAGVGQYICIIDSKAGIPNLTSPTYQRELQWGVELEDAWAVGTALSSTQFNVVQWNTPTELAWTQFANSSASQQLNAVSVLSDVDIWIVGNAGTVFRYIASTATSVATGITTSDNLQSVYAVSSQEVWTASGNSARIYKWTPATNWVATTLANNLKSISMVDSNGNGTADTGWVVGTNKTAYRYNGTTWTSTNTNITVDLTGVTTLSATDAYAVGATGKVFKWNGTTWTAMTSNTTNNLNGISMINFRGTDIGWAVGVNSTAINYNGTTWTVKTTGLAAGLTITAVTTVADNEAFLTASNGAIYEWNGTTWTLLFTSTKALNGIDIVHVPVNPTASWVQTYR